jgi:ATP synthase protein I
MAESEPDPQSPPDARLTALDERLRLAKEAEAVRTGQARKPADANSRLGHRVLGEMIGPPFGGAVIGYALDRWLGTSPWLLLVLLFLGFGIGIRNIVRLSRTPPPNGPGAGS